MKKTAKLIFVTLLCSMMICSLAACGESKEEVKTENTPTPEAIKAENTPATGSHYDPQGNSEVEVDSWDGWSSDKFQGPWTVTGDAEPKENGKPEWMGKKWIAEDEYAVLYENANGTIVAIFKKENDLLVEFDQTQDGDLVWKCDWDVTDVRGEEHEFIVGYEYHDAENDTYSDPIYACWDLDFELGWPMGYYDDMSDKNQQYVTVKGNNFNLIWAEKHTLAQYYYYWERIDNVYTQVDTYGINP